MGLSEDLKKILICQKAKACEQGQAVLEYILVLIVVVSIVLGVLYQFNDAFRNFLQSYFGDYLTCLLETGELPALGGEGYPNQGICSAGFKNFNVASGRSIVDPNTNRAAAENSRTSTNDENKNGSGGGNGGNGGGNQTSSPGKNSSSSRPGRFNKTNASTNAEAKLSDRPARQRLQMDQNSQGDEDTSKSKSGRIRSRKRTVHRRVMRLGEEYLTEKEKEKKEKTVGDGKKIIAEGGPVSNLRKARFDLKLPEPPKPTVKDKGFRLSIGFFIKFLVIAGIIIAIFLFLGSQVLQIKKSWQK